MAGDLKTDVENVAEPILTQEGYELVELKLARFKNTYRLQIFVDSDTGVTLDVCAHLSRLIGAALDLTDLFKSPYVLEISSPGLDRPLVTEGDFRRRVGEEVKVEYMDKGRTRRARGALTAVGTETISIAGKDGEITIALADVRQGKVII